MFEQLACCINLFVFFLLEKLLFFKLDGFLTDPQQIRFYQAPLSSFLDRSYCNLDPSRFLDFFSIDSRQLLDPSRSLCCGHLLITSRQLYLSKFKSRHLPIPLNPTRIVAFYIKLQRDFFLIFSRSLLTLFDSSPSQTPFSHSKPLPHSIFGLKGDFSLKYDLPSSSYHAFHLF